MKFIEHVRLLRRRWYFLALGFLVGAAAGWFTAPGSGATPVYYRASTTLIADRLASSPIGLEQAALLVTTGPVPAAVEAELGTRGSVSSTPDTVTQSLVIATTAGSPQEAEELAAAYAEALLAELTASSGADYQLALDDANAEVDAAEADASAVEQELAGLDPDDPARSSLQAELDAASARLTSALEGLRSLEAQGAPEPALVVIEQGDASRVTEGGVRAPDGKPQRALLLGIFGLLVGAAGAFVADRLETRIRGKHDAESSFGVPVIAEIPPLPGRRHQSELLTIAHPEAPVVEAYRALRTVVLYSAATSERPDHEQNGHNPARKVGAAQHADHESQVVLITSPGAGEGKTTTAAHLAALLAEVGKSVLVVSADFRRPRVHELFDVDREPGLSDVLTGESDRSIADLNLVTSVEGVRLLPSGSPVTNPAPFLRETAQLIAAARQLFDYIVIDTAPLLVANDATELAGVADTVIVLARADRTTRDAAERAIEILRRVDAPVLGAVVVAANDTPTAYSYYRNRYYYSDSSGNRRRSYSTRSDKPRTERPVAEPVADEVELEPNAPSDAG